MVNRCFSGDPGSILGRNELWAPTAQEPMDQNECLVTLLKALICISLEHKGNIAAFYMYVALSQSNLILGENDFIVIK